MPIGSLSDIAAVAIGVVGGILGGVAGAGATVYLTAKRAQKRAPKLYMLPEARIVAVSSRQHTTEFPSLWLQFIVQNRGAGDTAKDVEVLVNKVRSPSGPLRDVPPRPLKWTEAERERTNLSPGAARRIDIAHVLWPPNPDGSDPPRWPPTAGTRTMVALVLALYPRDPDDSRVVLDPGAYELELALTARDVPTDRYNCKVVLRRRDDVWSHAETPAALVAVTPDGVLEASEASMLEVQGPHPGPLPN